MVSSVEEVLKKESKKEYTNRAERAFIDFPIGVSTIQVSLQGLFSWFSLLDTIYKSHALLKRYVIHVK